MLHGCASLLPHWACGAADILLYLVPSLALAFLIWIVTAAHPLFFIFSAAGTLCHELVCASKRTIDNNCKCEIKWTCREQHELLF